MVATTGAVLLMALVFTIIGIAPRPSLPPSPPPLLRKRVFVCDCVCVRALKSRTSRKSITHWFGRSLGVAFTITVQSRPGHVMLRGKGHHPPSDAGALHEVDGACAVLGSQHCRGGEGWVRVRVCKCVCLCKYARRMRACLHIHPSTVQSM